MNHRALQRALVVALHDETFLAEMKADPVRAAPHLGETERRALLAVDPRALRTDPLRRRRLLRVLAEEYKASTTLALAETRSLAWAEAFFASPVFRAAIFGDRPLALAFGEYLAGADLATPQFPDVLRLEATRARCRRDRHRPPAPGVALAPGVAIASFDGGVLETIQTVEQYLFEIGLMPQVALCADAPRLPALLPLGARPPLRLLFTPSAADVGLAPIDDDLHGVLSALAAPRGRAEAVQALAGAGVPAGAAPDVLQSLLEDGLLAEGPPAGAPLLA